jgi:hypothetical protein
MSAATTSISSPPAVPRSGRDHPRSNILEAAYLLAILALTSTTAEVGAQYRMIHGPSRTGFGIVIYHNDLVGLLLRGSGTVWVVDPMRVMRREGNDLVVPNRDQYQLIRGWWSYLVYAAAAAILVKTPLLFGPVWLAGRALARRMRDRPLWAAYLAAVPVGALVGGCVFVAFISLRHGRPFLEFWNMYRLCGFASCVAGGACGAIALAGRGHRRGLGAAMAESLLMGVVVLATAWAAHCEG